MAVDLTNTLHAALSGHVQTVAVADPKAPFQGLFVEAIRVTSASTSLVALCYDHITYARHIFVRHSSSCYDKTTQLMQECNTQSHSRLDTLPVGVCQVEGILQVLDRSFLQQKL